MRVNISGLGYIKNYIPTKKEIVLEQEISIKRLKEICGLPTNVNVTIVVNSRVCNNEYLIKDNDDIKFVMIVNGG